jgi:hypothetical protein
MTQAIIEWLPGEEGGRRSGPPPGPRYIAPAKFMSHLDMWLVEDWSLVVNKIEELSSTHKWIANIHFLAANAPKKWLEPEARFELYEGNRTVALGRVIDIEKETESHTVQQ